MRLLALSVILPLVGCGDDTVRHIPDATTHDGPTVDGPDVDAAPAPVTLTITVDGSPMSGIHVYFQNADSSVVSATTTDATGTASAVMAAGGYVTALDPFVQPTFGIVANQLRTFAGVKPGDHLLLKETNTTGISFSVTLPLSNNANVTGYTISTPCGSAYVTGPAAGPPTTTLSLYGCGAATDFLVAAEQGYGRPLEFFYVPDQAVADGTPIDFSAQTFATADPRTYTLDNVPTTATSIDVGEDVASAKGRVYGSYTTLTGGTATVTGQQNVPTFTNAQHAIQTGLSVGAIGRHTFLDWGPYASTFTTDIGARMLPDFETVASYDETTHTLGWTEAAGGVDPDLVMTEIDGYRQADVRYWIWRLVAPRTGTSVVFPTLPTDVYDYNFAAGEAMPYGVTTAKVPGGYDAVRALIFATNGPLEIVTGATGSLTYEDMSALVGRSAGTTSRAGSPVHAGRRR